MLALILAVILYLVEALLFSRRRAVARDDQYRARLSLLDKEISDLKARLERLESQPPAQSSLDTHSANLSEAMRLAREGVSPGEMAERLGISRSEAELITALQRVES